MSIRCERRLIAAVTIAAIVCCAQEPVKPRLTPRVMTATRQVALFSGLEKQMLLAVEKKDKAALESMLADDCEVSNPKSDPLACQDWVDSVAGKDFVLRSFAIRSMSVTDLGDAALVNFERIQKATSAGKDLSGEFFVVDLWRKSGDAWKLANRYVSRIESATANPTLPAPSGKE